MKHITFKKNSKGEYYTFSFGNEYQDKPTYLRELAQSGLMFAMTQACTRFTAKVGDTVVMMYTDQYGNKILKYY